MANANENADLKLRELILYLSVLSEGDEFFGATKLNKLLFYVDFLSFRATGKAITEQEYQALPQGPAPRRLLPAMDSLKDSGSLIVRHEPVYNYVQKRPIALRQANLDAFSPAQIDLINKVVKSLWRMTATQVSDLSHQFIGWQLADPNETIPYSVALLSTDDLTEEELRYANDVEKRAQIWQKARAA
ncbi:MAG: Panacea domain-containing protein [Candidatus Binataceae bacterium]